MKIEVKPTALEGVVVISTPHFQDERGFFIEAWHRRHYLEAGIDVDFVQDNHSRSGKGVLRGLHYQDMTAPMGKLVRCTLGRIFDVAVDLRVGSATFGKWAGAELTEENMDQLWVPPGFAHGFVVLSDNADVQYKCTGFYTPSSEGSLAWNDPQVAIDWPVSDPQVSKKDGEAPSLARYLESPAFKYPVGAPA